MSLRRLSRSITSIGPTHAWRLKDCLPANTAIRVRNSAKGWRSLATWRSLSPPKPESRSFM